jgi:D-glycero-D-manno-heptose 1,7-bisphosphate phosphatase
MTIKQHTPSRTKLIILDRDGVINYDSPDYIKSVDEWLPIESSLTAIARLNHAGYKVAIATNQSGLARGYFDLKVLDAMHAKMQHLLSTVGGNIDAIEFCSDHPDNATHFRKPRPGMAEKLLSLFDADPKQTWFVGDSLSDIQSAQQANCRPALVLSGKGKSTLEKITPDQAEVFQDLASFVDFLLKQN